MKKFLIFLCVAGLITGCAERRRQNVLGNVYSNIETKSYQSRKYDTDDKDLVLRGVISTMQDLGFIVDRANKDMGVVSGTSFKQNSKITVFAHPTKEKQIVVRVNAQVKKKELTEPVAYQNFFDLLSKSLFLEAHPVE